LLRLRRETPALRTLDLSKVETHADELHRVLLVRRDTVLLAFNFGERTATVEIPFAIAPTKALLDTGAKVEGGKLTLPPSSFALFSS